MKKDYILSHDDSPWQCIFCVVDKNESPESAILHEVEKETTIRLEKVEFLGDEGEGKDKKNYYYGILTDADVNKIVRLEGKLLGFFAVKELKKILLSETTQGFFKTYPEALQKVSLP